MLIPIGPVKNIPVALLDVASSQASIIDAHVIHFNGRAYQVKLPPGTRVLSPDDLLLVDFGEGSSGRRRVRVESYQDGVVTLELVGRARQRERREYPRIEGPIQLEYRLEPKNDPAGVEAWLERPHLDDAGHKWFRTEQEMEFSVTGLRFTTDQPIPPATIMAVKFRLLRQGRQQYCAGAEVVRLEPLGDGQYGVAVLLFGQTEKTYSALMEYTRICQDYVLGLDFMPEE